MYEQGQGVIIDERAAVKWCQKSANQGNVLGKAKLGRMYYAGRGIKKDESVSTSLFNQVSREIQNGAQAGNKVVYQYLLGWMYGLWPRRTSELSRSH